MYRKALFMTQNIKIADPVIATVRTIDNSIGYITYEGDLQAKPTRMSFDTYKGQITVIFSDKSKLVTKELGKEAISVFCKKFREASVAHKHVKMGFYAAHEVKAAQQKMKSSGIDAESLQQYERDLAKLSGTLTVTTPHERQYVKLNNNKFTASVSA